MEFPQALDHPSVLLRHHFDALRHEGYGNDRKHDGKNKETGHSVCLYR